MTSSAAELRIVDLLPHDEPLIEAIVPISVRVGAVVAPDWLPTPAHARAEIVSVAAGALTMDLSTSDATGATTVGGVDLFPGP